MNEMPLDKVGLMTGDRGHDAVDQTSDEERAVFLAFLTELGRAMVASGQPITMTEQSLSRAARAYGAKNVGVAALPTALFIKFDISREAYINFSASLRPGLRLDQIAAVFDVARAAEDGTVAPREGLDLLATMHQSAPRFNRLVTVAGHTIIALGLSLVLVPSQQELVAVAFLGTFVGVIKAFTNRRGVYTVPLSVLAAFLVGVIVFVAYRYGYGSASINLLIPALVTFLPGGMLTMAMVELAYGEMIAGSSRLMTGFVQLLLLIFGVLAAGALVGVPPDKLVSPVPHATLPAWSPWLGVLVYGFGTMLHLSAPPRAFWWIVLVLYTAYSGQALGNLLFGASLSGFVGAMAMMPLVYLIQDRLKGPPSMVTFLPGFWILVPGALGFTSLAQIAGNNSLAGLDSLFTTIYSLTAIALGCLVGTTLYQLLDEWLLQWWERH